jgi:5-methyltetrahydropteroyltriglutamate--homocysteine methyltransferase
MTPRSLPPFRADHVGSLLRPKRLLDARQEVADGTIDAAALAAVEDDAILEVIGMLEAVGMQSVTDGEFRRSSWHMDFLYQIKGITRSEDSVAVHFKNSAGDLTFDSATPRASARIAIDEPIFGDAFAFLRKHTASGTPKLTIPSPSMLHYRGGPSMLDPAVYPDEEEFWADLSTAYANELKGLAALGCTYLQLDDTSLAYLNDPAQRAMMESQGRDSAHQHERYISVINAAISGRPSGLSVTMHLCRGNFRDSWAAEGSYDFVAEALFGQLDVNGFFLEYDDERSGGFEPLRFVPPGKYVVLGLVTTKRSDLESKDGLKRRIDEASRFIPLEQLCLSPQCGFSSTVEGNSLSEDDQRAKLELVVETAAEVWG